MSPSTKHTTDWIKRRINVAKADKGMSWAEIAAKLSSRGRRVTASSLMSKHSRASFSGVELVTLLRVLDVHTLELPND